MTYLQTARNLERHIFISIKLCKSSGIVAAELQSDAYLMYRSGTEQFNAASASRISFPHPPPQNGIFWDGAFVGAGPLKPEPT
jgi:hypothetical protein